MELGRTESGGRVTPVKVYESDQSTGVVETLLESKFLAACENLVNEDYNTGDSHAAVNTPPAHTKTNFMNPFDTELIERLHLPSYSPSVFAVVDTPNRDEKGWSIEQIAVLHPADIDEEIHEDTESIGTDTETEQKAQDAITRFFSQREIVPSPWCPSQKFSPVVAMACLKKSVKSKDEDTRNVWTQTALSLPVDYDLQAVLGNYYTNEDLHAKGSIDRSPSTAESNLSTSTLRRKLFVHDSSYSSPDKYSSPECNAASPPHSLLTKTPGTVTCLSISSSSSCQLSSSPINLGIRTSNSSHSHVSPLSLSPIKSCSKTPCSSDCSECENSCTNGYLPRDERMISLSPIGTAKRGTLNGRNLSTKFSECHDISTQYEDGRKIIVKSLYHVSEDTVDYNDEMHMESVLGAESYPATNSQDTGYQSASLQAINSQDYMQISNVQLPSSSLPYHVGEMLVEFPHFKVDLACNSEIMHSTPTKAESDNRTTKER